MFEPQNNDPTGTVNIASATFIRRFRQREVIKAGHKKMCAFQGRV
jgi:hypothetical protein